MVYKLEGEELKEYLDAIEVFSDKVSQIFFKGLREIIEKPGTKVPVTLDSVMTAIDNDLLNNVTPKILHKIDKMLASDIDLLNKNNAIRSVFDNMTAVERQEAISEFYKEQTEALNKIYSPVKKQDENVVDELSKLFGGKIDPETMN